MNITSIVENIANFIQFISTTYGTGDLMFDLLVVTSAFLVVVVFIAFLQVAETSKDDALNDFDDIQDTVENLRIHLSELKAGVVCELEKWRKELGFFQQELSDIGARKKAPEKKVETQMARTDRGDMASLFRQG